MGNITNKSNAQDKTGNFFNMAVLGFNDAGEGGASLQKARVHQVDAGAWLTRACKGMGGADACAGAKPNYNAL